MSFWNPFRRSEQSNEAGQANEIKVIVKWNKDRLVRVFVVIDRRSA